MKCTYIYKGTKYESYQSLVSAIIAEAKEDNTLLNNDILFSALEDIKNRLLEIKLEYFDTRLEIQKSGPEIIAAGENSKTYDLLHFIDSDFYKSDYYTKLNPDDHKKAVVIDLINKGIPEKEAIKLVQEMYEHFNTIGADSYVLHKLINTNNFNGSLLNVIADFLQSIRLFIAKNNAEMNDSNKTLLTSYNKAAAKLVPHAAEICEGIRGAVMGAFALNKINMETSTMVKNIGLKLEIESLGLSLLGHIDFAIIDAEGNLSLYNYKVTSENLDFWEKSKLEKYKHEMVFLKHILSNKGFNFKNISLNLIPIKVLYNEDFTDLGNIIINSNPINLDIKNGKDSLKNVNKEVSKYIPPKDNIDVSLSDSIERSIQINLAIFPDLNIRKNRISKTATAWIANNSGRKNAKGGSIVELDLDPEYTYKVITDDGKITMIKDKSAPKNNKEIIDVVTKYFDDLDNSIDRVTSALLKNIRVAYTTGVEDFTSFGKASGYLQNVLSYYYSYKDVDGNKVFDWQYIENAELSDLHILMFQNKKTKLIDVISLSMCNLSEKNKGKGDNILNGYLYDAQAGELFKCKNYFGNIETIRTLTILNEILPKIDIDFKLGNIKVISPVNGGNGINYAISDFTKNFIPQIYQIVNLNNSGLNIVNNFNKFLYVDTFDSIQNQIDNILNNKQYAINTHDKEIFLNYKTFEVEDIKTQDGRIKVLTEIAKRLQDQYSDVIEKYSPYSDTKTKAIVNLYYTITQALAKQHGYDLVVKNETLGKLGTEFIKFSNINDENARVFNEELDKTVFKINEQMFKEFDRIKPICDKFLTSKGYSSLLNSTIGNEAMLFDNLYERDTATNTRQMIFKNPFTDRTLSPAESEFLKHAIFEFAKVRHDINYPKAFKSIEDPDFKASLESDNKRLLWVPLIKGTIASKRLKFTLLKTVEKFKEALSNPKEKLKQFFDNAKLSDYESNIVEDFSLINPFLESEGMYSQRQALINTHEDDYYETNVKNLLIKFAYENIRTREMNTMLIIDKSLMFNIKMFGINSNNSRYTTQLLQLIEKFMKVNIYNESLLEETSKKIFSYIDPLKKAVRNAYLAGNIIGLVRDLTEGLQLNLMRTITKYQTDISTVALTKAYGIVTKDCFSNINTINKVNMLCLRFGLSNIDYADVTLGLRTDRGGILNFESYMYATMKRPDFINRMTLFVARCIQDGCWDAFSINENGQLDYDWKKDARFKDYASGNTSSSKYNELMSLYYSKIREYNQEHPNNPITYKDNLPTAYSNSYMNYIKDVSNSIYGAFEKNERALYEHQAIGLAFGMFSTWMNGAIANYMKKPGLYNNGQHSLVLETDEAGNLLFFDNIGNITNEDTGVPVMKSVPILVQGVWYTLVDTAKILFNEDDKWDAVKKLIWNDPMQRLNLAKFLSDFLMSILSLILFKMVLQPGYNEYVKNADMADVFSNFATHVMYKGVSNSWDGFKGPITVFSYIGNGLTPPYQAFTLQVAKLGMDLAMGNTTVTNILSKDVAPIKAFQIQLKLMQNN